MKNTKLTFEYMLNVISKKFPSTKSYIKSKKTLDNNYYFFTDGSKFIIVNKNTNVYDQLYLYDKYILHFLFPEKKYVEADACPQTNSNMITNDDIHYLIKLKYGYNKDTIIYNQCEKINTKIGNLVFEPKGLYYSDGTRFFIYRDYEIREIEYDKFDFHSEFSFIQFVFPQFYTRIDLELEIDEDEIDM